MKQAHHQNIVAMAKLQISGKKCNKNSKPDNFITNPVHNNITTSAQRLECFAPLRETKLISLISLVK